MRDCKSSVFRFSGFEVREREFCLIKGGEMLTVEPKAFRVLLFLLRSPRKLVTKEQLMNAVWGDAAVTENSLTRCISMLRRVLGDDASEPRYIATVATVGYRFLCCVEVCEAEDASPEGAVHAKGANNGAYRGIFENGDGHAASTVTASTAYTESAEAVVNSVPEAKGGNRRLVKWWIVGAAILGVGIASITRYVRRPLPMFHVSKYTQITHDGRRKVPLGTDGVRLYLNEYPDADPPSQVALSGGEAARIPMALPNPWLVDVSTDGSTLLVMAHNESTGSLWSVPVLGTSLRHLADVTVESGAWSPNGKSVVFSAMNGDVDLVSSEGTGLHRLANVPYQSSNFFAERTAWSPDGKAIRFDRNNKIYEIKPDGSGLHPFLPDWHASSARCCGRWTPNGEFFEFLLYDPPASTEFAMQPATQIWVLDERRGLFLRAREPVQLTSGPTRWGRPIPAKDGKKIYAMGATQSGELMRLDGKSHLLVPYLGGISAEGVTFSPDGRFIAYVSFPEGILWRADRDGTHPVQLTDPPLYPSEPRWSPNGEQILFFAANEKDTAKSYIVSSRGGASRLILPEDKGSEGHADWSPDGRKVIFDSWVTSESSWPEIRILDVASGKVSKLPGSEGEWSPRWSPDGRFIAALDPGTSNLTLFNFETQRWSVLQKRETGFPTWSLDGRLIYFECLGDDPGVFRIRPSGGEVARAVDLKGFHPAGVFGNWMGLDPDGRPMLLRDAGGIDIYALDLEQR
jgi:DNA-binding winged helix-turn-helix (wHTH) protein/Tol biopolymer transport system component